MMRKNFPKEATEACISWEAELSHYTQGAQADLTTMDGGVAFVLEGLIPHMEECGGRFHSDLSVEWIPDGPGGVFWIPGIAVVSAATTFNTKGSVTYEETAFEALYAKYEAWKAKSRR